MLFWKASCLLSALSIASAKLTWGTTQFLFTFGDSYTTDGFNISAGVDSPVPGFVGARYPAAITTHFLTPSVLGQTSSNGPNWVQFLGNPALSFYAPHTLTASSQGAHTTWRTPRYNSRSFTRRGLTRPPLKVFNLASGGATIDAALVAPFEPTVLYVKHLAIRT